MYKNNTKLYECHKHDTLAEDIVKQLELTRKDERWQLLNENARVRPKLLTQ